MYFSTLPLSDGIQVKKREHGKPQFDSWMTVQRGHAIANGVYVAAVNRIGLEKENENSAGIEFWGSSFICDPQGVIIAQASKIKKKSLWLKLILQELNI